MTARPVLPGQTLGILGGGQLGRMMAMAARSLGYQLKALDPDPACPAAGVVDECVTAAFDDAQAAAQLARGCAVVTLEIEKIGPAALAAVEALVPLRPSAAILQMIQDRVAQKQWLSTHGFPVGPFASAGGPQELEAAVGRLGLPAYVKASRGGYDGKGQAIVRAADGCHAAWSEVGAHQTIVERGLDLKEELSVLVARTPSGRVAVYPPALNRHERGILAWSVLPAPVEEKVARQATEIAASLAQTLRLEGLLVVEFFHTASGELLVNELAPRPHNSFHSTEVSCVTSQFEQAVRAVCDLPLGSTEILRPGAIVNLLGDLWMPSRLPAFDAALEVPGVSVHLYGKPVARPGRKMGHLAALGATAQEALARVQEAERRLAAYARP